MAWPRLPMSSGRSTTGSGRCWATSARGSLSRVATVGFRTRLVSWFAMLCSWRTSSSWRRPRLVFLPWPNRLRTSSTRPRYKLLVLCRNCPLFESTARHSSASTSRDSPHLDVILESGPQAVYTAESLRKKANSIIKNSAAKTSMASFATGLPGNPAVMIAAGGADVAQYFGFAINLAQQIAYLFGEDDLFDGGGQLSEAAQMRVIAYLGAMLGAAGAAALVSQTSKVAGANLGKKVAAQALTKTAWYPLVKKVGAVVGQKITKKTVEKTITKAVPVFGGAVSGGLT